MRLDTLHARYIDRLSGQLRIDPMLFVPGEGKKADPLLMLVGEAPGEQETLLRRPFVGKAGKNLDAFLQVLGIERAEIYITNVVKIRPTKVSAKGRLSNRPPNRQEKEAFTPWLMEEIDILRPRRIVTLGNTPLQALMGGDALIGSWHGQCVRTAAGIPLFALYHPAAIIYNRALTDTYQQDLLKLRRCMTGQ